MEREEAVAWLEAYRRAWEGADARGVLELFTADARYRAHPLRPAHTGHDGVADYWARATAGQRDVRVRLGADAFRIDGVMRRIPDHFHAHARDPAWPGFAWS